MERRSDKHGPRIDEEMKLETSSIVQGASVESRADERREKEPPASGEPTPDDRLRGDRGRTPEGALSPDQVEVRQEFARHIQGSVFPATRDEVIASARELDAPEPVLRQLASLPERTFDSFADVWEALGGPVEHHAR